MGEKLTRLTENTFVPLSFILVIVGGVFWLTMLYAESSANAKGLENLQVKYQDLEKAIASQNAVVLDRLGKIEGRLESIQHER